MKILDVLHYKDGGTVLVLTDEGNYAFDRRLGSCTVGALFKGMPQKDNRNMIMGDAEEIKNRILDAMSQDSRYTVARGFHPFSILDALKDFVE